MDIRNSSKIMCMASVSLSGASSTEFMFCTYSLVSHRLYPALKYAPNLTTYRTALHIHRPCLLNTKMHFHRVCLTLSFVIFTGIIQLITIRHLHLLFWVDKNTSKLILCMCFLHASSDGRKREIYEPTHMLTEFWNDSEASVVFVLIEIYKVPLRAGVS